eukprot:m.174057 g.174057  ORF g.174057 m.174057 type:complete len:413 (+) comp31751_c0_seq2:175-1413(+)
MSSTSEPTLKVRAVTRFVVLPRDQSQWQSAITTATHFCATLASRYTEIGYETQTLRIVSNPFGEWLDCSSIETVLDGLALLKAILDADDSGIRIRFAVGAATTQAQLLLVPRMIKEYGDLCNICVNVEADVHGLVDAAMCEAAADVIVKLSKETLRGEGNFNFTANFCCPPLIPYFPAGYNTAKSGESVGIGLEHPDLIYSVLQSQNLSSVPSSLRAAVWGKTAILLRDTIEAHTKKLVQIAQVLAREKGIRFAGLDSSAAPSKDVTSMCKIYQCLGVPHFGASGTVEASAFLTRVFKSIRVENADLIGFSGLMLTCLEDMGMASCAAEGHYDIRALLQYSCVCGIGLDCVPIPGDTPVSKIAALMRDTGTLAFRYKKPLTVRLFPCAGLNVGDMTAFESDDLCNCTVFKVD